MVIPLDDFNEVEEIQCLECMYSDEKHKMLKLKKERTEIMKTNSTKKNIAITFILALLLLVSAIPASALPQAYANSEHEISSEEQAFEKLAMERGLEFATNYMRSLDLLDHLYENFQVSRSGDIVYPDNFGGVFFDDDGFLVINQVTGDASVLETLNFTRIDSGFISGEVTFSYNYLWSLMDVIRTTVLYDEGNPATGNVHGWMLDVVENRIFVDVDEYSAQHVNDFWNYISSSAAIEFRETPRRTGNYEARGGLGDQASSYLPSPPLHPPQQAPLHARVRITVNAGDLIWVWRPSVGGWISAGSAGYGVVVWGSRGFTTAEHLSINSGHGGLRNNDIIADRNGAYLGTVRIVELRRDDSAFVEMGWNIDFVHPHGVPRRLGHNTARTPVRVRAQSTSRNGGHVNGPWQGFIDGVFISGVEAYLETYPGCSGGLIYSVAGIHGMVSNSAVWHHVVFIETYRTLWVLGADLAGTFHPPQS